MLKKIKSEQMGKEQKSMNAIYAQQKIKRKMAHTRTHFHTIAFPAH